MFKKVSEAKVKDFMCQIMDTYETLKPKTKKAIVLKTCPKSPYSSKSKLVVHPAVDSPVKPLQPPAKLPRQEMDAPETKEERRKRRAEETMEEADSLVYTTTVGEEEEKLTFTMVSKKNTLNFFIFKILVFFLSQEGYPAAITCDMVDSLDWTYLHGSASGKLKLS